MLQIIPVPAFNDNYIWLLLDESSRTAWAVDPGDAEPVFAVLNQLQYQLAGILLTHHHSDHSGGIDTLRQHWGNIPVFASHHSKIAAVNHPLKEGDMIFCGSTHFKVLEIPGHTLDHVAYYNEKVLFSGDTLFSIGCGRVFEGTPAQMVETLQKLAQLPDEIKMYCGHEYTLANLLFAQHVEPENQFIANKLQQVKKLRQQNQPTLPAILADEKKLNPFLRCQNRAIISAVEQYAGKVLSDPVEVFAQLRLWKNHF